MPIMTEEEYDALDEKWTKTRPNPAPMELRDPAKNMQALANSYNCDPQLIYDAYDLSLKNARPLPIIPVILSAAGPYQQTLSDLGDQLMSAAITCKPGEFDRVWDDGIKNWLASGAQVIIDGRAAKYIAP
jgi:putative aldouronate transport system substrate-binding protein